MHSADEGEWSELCLDCDHRISVHREATGVCGPCSVEPSEWGTPGMGAPPYSCAIMFYILPADETVAEAIKGCAEDVPGHDEGNDTLTVYIAFATGRETAGSFANRLTVDLELGQDSRYSLHGLKEDYSMGAQLALDSALQQTSDVLFLGHREKSASGGM